MREAVIVATARTPIGRAYRGAFNNIKSPTLMGHAIAHAVSRSGVDPVEIQDVVTGSVLDAGTAGMNIARNAALAAGLPYSVAAQTMDRQCASGLMAVATAAKQVIVDGMDVVVAGGQENISALQTPYMDWVAREQDDNVLARAPHAYMPMLQTAEHVSRKYAISRESQAQARHARIRHVAGVFRGLRGAARERARRCRERRAGREGADEYEYPTPRLWRDAKLYEIGAGTSEIRRMLIGRELFAETA